MLGRPCVVLLVVAESPQTRINGHDCVWNDADREIIVGVLELRIVKIGLTLFAVRGGSIPPPPPPNDEIGRRVEKRRAGPGIRNRGGERQWTASCTCY